jgi:molecular chaperone GrpE
MKNNKSDQDNTVIQDVNIQELQDTITHLEQESMHNLAGWQRAQADYQNLKRESDRLRVESIQLANKNLIETLIPVFDNFALALKHLPTELTDNTWAQGIVFIHRQLQDILLAEGVEIIDPLGQEFNPHIHEAVDSEGEGSSIVEVLQVGYTLHGKLIRSARVKVSS